MSRWQEYRERAGEFFQTGPGKAAGVGICALCLLVLYFVLTRGTPGEELAANRVYICSKTLKSFKVRLTPGLEIPVKSPYSGEATGYPAEACYWNADGSVRKDPFYVCLNAYRGLPEPTFCPDCGRLVRGHNPAPAEGHSPPPTEAEFTAHSGRHGSNVATDRE